MIWDKFTSKSMKDKLEQLSDYASTLSKDPVALLKAIKLQMHDTVRAQYSEWTRITAMEKLLSFRQQDLSLAEYIIHFKELRDIYVTQNGTGFNNSYVASQTEGFNELTLDEKIKLQKEAYDRWIAIMFIKHADMRQYGSLIDDLQASFARNCNEYPRNLEKAIDLLDSRKLDSNFKSQASTLDKASKSKSNPTEKDKKKPETSFTQNKTSTFKCHCCGSPDHTPSNCPLKDKVPRSEWFKETGRKPSNKPSHTQTDSNHDDSSVGSASKSKSNSRSGSGKKKGWCNLMIHNQTSDIDQCDLRDLILLDTGSTIGATVCNSKFIANVKPTTDILHMTTNAGCKNVDLKGEVLGLGNAWFDPKFITNIFGFSHLIDLGYEITYDSKIEDAFICKHRDFDAVKFQRTKEGLYVYKPTQNYVKAIAEEENKDEFGDTFLIKSVSENIEGFTKREIEAAKRAKKFYNSLGCPSIATLKNLIRMNAIKNCPITTEDISIAEKIYGPDPSTLKGKSTRSQPPAVINDEIELPDELSGRDDLTLCMDIMFVWGIPFLTTIDKTVRFRATVPLNSQKSKEVYKALDSILRHYNDAGYFFKFIHCDQEFRSLMDQVADELNVKMNYASTGEHVPEAERNNRTIKDRVRTTYHQLPYKRIPKVLIRKLVMRATKMLNLLPAKGGISSYLSPYTIVTRRVVDYEKEFSTSFGAYVQANQDNTPTNTNLPRTLDCIFLGPTSGKQPGYELLNLATGQVIVRPKIRELPITDIIIDAVEKLADKDGIKSMKFSRIDGLPFEDPAWIAGVENDENKNDENGDDTNFDSDDEDSDSDNDSDSDETSDDEEFITFDDEGQKLIDDTYKGPDFEPNVMDDEDEEEIQEYNYPDHEHLNPTEMEETNKNIVDESTVIDPISTEKIIEAQPSADNEPPPLELRRSTRERKEPVRYGFEKLQHCHNIVTIDDAIEYDPVIAGVAALFIHEVNEVALMNGHQFGQQYIVQEGLKKFGKKGKVATLLELCQLHN